jgi:hypothetical protein
LVWRGKGERDISILPGSRATEFRRPTALGALPAKPEPTQSALDVVAEPLQG